MTLLRAIDFETSAFEPRNEGDPKPEICEVGWTDLAFNPTVPNAEIGKTVSELCLPGDGFITAEASSVHHIVAADVLDQASFDDIRPRLFNGSPSYFVAHGADFERSLFDAGETPWIDTYKIALRIWPDAPAHKLQVLRYHLDLPRGREIGAAHRAGPDSLLCALLMQRIIEADKFSLADMVRFSDGPALLPRVPFGMHYGKKWDDVPTSYLDWIVEKSDLDRDIKANAKLHRSRRDGA